MLGSGDELGQVHAALLVGARVSERITHYEGRILQIDSIFPSMRGASQPLTVCSLCPTWRSSRRTA
jgi:hypothetical protein